MQALAHSSVIGTEVNTGTEINTGMVLKLSQGWLVFSNARLHFCHQYSPVISGDNLLAVDAEFKTDVRCAYRVVMLTVVACSRARYRKQALTNKKRRMGN